MSAKKSWDVRPNAGRAVRITTGPALPQRVRASAGTVNLKDRRRRARRRYLGLCAALLLILVGAIVYTLWRPELRIRHLSFAASDSIALESIVGQALKGTIAGVFPRNSILFFPKEQIRRIILDTYPEVAAVSVVRTGVDSIHVQAISRVRAFEWCGTHPDSASACYQADAEGYLFAPSLQAGSPDGAIATSTPTLRVYGPISGAEADSVAPLRARLTDTFAISPALRVQRVVTSLRAEVASLYIRKDEADMTLVGGTRITYLLGEEERAAQMIVVAAGQLTLTDGSVEYVDVRFKDRIYLKRAGASEAHTL